VFGVSWEIRQGDALERLREMPDESVQTVCTSPPFWGLRDYGTEGQLGLEPTPEQYVANLVAVFREVRRVLRSDGTVWLNLGDSYCNAGSSRNGEGLDGSRRGGASGPDGASGYKQRDPRYSLRASGIKHKDLVGIPWRVAFALQADGWWLRSDIIWSKPNPMPESVTDRPTRAHEYIFMLTRSARYFWDADAIREEPLLTGGGEVVGPDKAARLGQTTNGLGRSTLRSKGITGRNRRSVWEIATAPYKDAHFAVFPPKLVEPCILAGSPPKCCGECGAPWERVTETERPEPAVLRPKDPRVHLGHSSKSTINQSNWHDDRNPKRETRTLGWRSTCAHDDDSGHSVVLDPFCGSGTTGVVALRHDRSFIGIELSPAYCELARNRIRDDAPLLNTGLEVAA
jgi:DNA modification methylase